MHEVITRSTLPRFILHSPRDSLEEWDIGVVTNSAQHDLNGMVQWLIT